MIAIIENSPGLAAYFERGLEERGVAFRTFAVHEGGPFPDGPFEGYILTGDYANISDGLEPRHGELMAFIRSIPAGARVFGSCFAHQLLAHLHGGRVRRRGTRFFGWKEIRLEVGHPVLAGLDSPRFVCLNGDEVAEPAPGSRVIGSADDCSVQVATYGENVITFQSHPELLRGDVAEIVARHGPALQDRCSEIERLHEEGAPLADDAVNRRFLDNLVGWLVKR